VRRLTALVPGSIVAPSVGAGRPVWEHLVGTVGATADDRSIRVPVCMPTTLGDEARRELVHRAGARRIDCFSCIPGRVGERSGGPPQDSPLFSSAWRRSGVSPS